ncbi:MAG: hypothetical protein HY701_06035 [Gemmatimonadetes bacterium]|nr:hypothetical protein [Gemmatimonadota bacterium]
MSRRAPAATVALAIATAALSLGAVPVAAQDPSGAPPARAVPRTSDGRPDLQGYWTNDSYTPLERPVELGTKMFFTDEEAAAYLKRNLDLLHGQSRDNIHYDDAIWQGENYQKLAHVRTSLIVDPPDGRIPPLAREGAARETRRVEASRHRGPADSAEHRSLAERCISWGNVGPPMLPPTYNANFQILQTPGSVVIRYEMMHDVRIIPMDGRPHLGAGLRQLAGDSRGRWDGETLVVETTNFTNETNFRGAPARTRQDIFASAALRVVERFTPLDADTIRYEFTVEDPQTWTKPWSGEMPIRRFDGPIYEFACHEGNYGLPNILSAARVLGQ